VGGAAGNRRADPALFFSSSLVILPRTVGPGQPIVVINPNGQAAFGSGDITINFSNGTTEVTNVNVP